MYHKLRAVDAPFWAAISLDIQHCLWARMSQKFSGREPSKTQFLDTYTEAVTRQMALPLTWRAGESHRFFNRFGDPQTLPVKVVLDVPRIANQEAPRDTMVGSALQTKSLLHVVEAEVITAPTDVKFVLALMLTVSTFSYKTHPLQLFMLSQFTASWVRYRSRCYEKAALVVLPHTVHDYSGLLPEPQGFTTAFRSKLQNLLDDYSKGWGLLHEHPSVLDLANSPTQAPGFVWFGNLVLREVVHRALYDPTYAGWFGFLEDVSLSNGHRFWTPLRTASPRQVGQVLGWVSIT